MHSIAEGLAKKQRKISVAEFLNATSRYWALILRQGLL